MMRRLMLIWLLVLVPTLAQAQPPPFPAPAQVIASVSASGGTTFTITGGPCGSTVGVQSISSAGAVTCWGATTFDGAMRSLTLTPTVNAIGFTASGGSTTSGTVVPFSYFHTLNTATAPTVFKVAVTDTAHGVGTNIFQLLGGVAAATNLFKVDTAGSITSAGGGSAAAPDLVWGASGLGFYAGNSNTRLVQSYNGNDFLNLDGGAQARFVSGALIGWTASTTAATGALDTDIYRSSAGLVGVGTTGSSPTGAVIALGYRTSGTTAVAVANVGANSCGTSAASIAGNDNVGIITVGATSGTQCRVAFTFAAANRWICQFQDETTANIMRPNYVDTTHVDVLGTMVAGDVINYICFPR